MECNTQNILLKIGDSSYVHMLHVQSCKSEVKGKFWWMAQKIVPAWRKIKLQVFCLTARLSLNVL